MHRIPIVAVMGEDGHASQAGHGRVSVFCPMRIERLHVEREARRRGIGPNVSILQTGIGKDAVIRSLREHRGDLVILAGACGGLAGGAEVGVVSRVVDEHGGAWTPTVTIPGLGLTVVGVDRIVSTPEDKRALAAEAGASVVDMESHAFAAECTRLGAAWAIVRGVSDAPNETLPAELLGWITPEGNTRGVRAALHMVRRPSLVPHIMGVMRRSNRILPQVGRQVADLVRSWRARNGEQ